MLLNHVYNQSLDLDFKLGISIILTSHLQISANKMTEETFELRFEPEGLHIIPVGE